MLFEGIAATAVGFGIVRFDREGALKASQRFVEHVALQPGVSPVVMGFGIVRLDREGAGVVGQRLIQPLEFKKGDAAVVKERGIFGMHRQHPGEKLHRFFILTCLRGKGRQQLQRIKIAGLDAHNFFINGPGLIPIARLMQRKTLLQRLGYHTRCGWRNGSPRSGFGNMWCFLRHRNFAVPAGVLESSAVLTFAFALIVMRKGYSLDAPKPPCPKSKKPPSP